MAQKLVIVDDRTGEEGAEPVHLGVQGLHFEIDLADTSKQQLVDALKPFLSHARLPGKVRPADVPDWLEEIVPVPRTWSTATTGRHDKERVANCKTWLDSQGVRNIPTGRLADELWDAFETQNVSRLSAKYRPLQPAAH